MSKCHACVHSYMEPDADYLICGHKDSGSLGLYVKTGPVPHCGNYMKFSQHPLRRDDGGLFFTPEEELVASVIRQ